MKADLIFLLLVPFIFDLTGCRDHPATLHLFGPVRSCFDNGHRVECPNLKVYPPYISLIVMHKGVH